jgi:preprotein translocase subunit SecD
VRVLRLFGVFSTLALALNLLLLVAVLSMLQATLTLPGMAAIALVLGMAIDANVLINERVREELRGGASPQAAIHAGYERAFATILDSNVDHAHRRPGAARLRLRPDPRLRDRALPGHPHVDVLGRAVLARPGEPVLRPPEEAKGVSIGQVWRPQADAPAKS